MATQVDMPIQEGVTHTTVDRPSQVRAAFLAVDMSIPTAAVGTTVDPLIPAHASIPEGAVVTMGVAATTMVEKDTMADVGITEAMATMVTADISAEDMGTSVGEASI
jgi:hypothetical protein